MAGIASEFRVEQFYSNDLISNLLSVGNAGGIRPSLRADGSIRRLVLLTALPLAKVAAENPYHDRVESDILIYTGKGLRGNQEPGGLNRRLVEQLNEHFPVWCFQQGFSRRDKKAGKDRWKFLGLLTLIRFHNEQQLDADGKFRSVWLFEFDISSESRSIGIEEDTALAKAAFTRVAESLSNDPEEQVVADVEGDVISDAVLEKVRCWLLAQHPRDFELIVQRAFEAAGYRDVAVTRYTQDGGIDILASFGQAGWPVRNWQVQVQAKRWLHTVGRKEVAELRGSLKSHGLGCLIATSYFSKAAVAEATEPGKSPITLINGREFASLIVALGISPSTIRA